MKIGVLSLLVTVPFTLAWSPTDSYAPGVVDCPSNGTLVRSSSGLSSKEKAWVAKRHNVTDIAMLDYFSRANLTDFDYETFLSNVSLNIGMSFSGGGLRAMLCGAGQFSALDNRTTNSTTSGLGGIVQASTYITGLSGGNWFVGTLVMNNWTSVQEILEPDSGIWNLEHQLYNPGGLNVIKTAAFWDQISDDIDDKRDAGFNVSLTDPWGRMLAQHFFDMSVEETAAYTWSTIQEMDAFTNYDMPFPIMVADGRSPDTTIINLNSTVFEISPFELGTWDPSLEAFTNVKYLGTNVTKGESVNGSCIAGFDNAGFILGTSSTLFNQFILQINSTSLSGSLYDLAVNFLSDLGENYDDIAIYAPNPFTDFNDLSKITSADFLSLVDGGEDGQNVPLYPLLQEERDVDLIFAFDNSADTDYYWPNGTSLVSTYERQFGTQGNKTSFPYVPDVKSFLNLNMTARPAFFGCNASNLTDLSHTPPLVIYIANRPFSYPSNVSTFTLKYEEDDKRSMIQNGYEVASRYNLTLDSEWPACVACAIIRREQERRGDEQSDQCKKCFTQYCWSGNYDESGVEMNFTETGMTNGSSTVAAGIRLQPFSTAAFLAWGLFFAFFLFV